MNWMNMTPFYDFCVSDFAVVVCVCAFIRFDLLIGHFSHTTFFQGASNSEDEIVLLQAVSKIVSIRMCYIFYIYIIRSICQSTYSFLVACLLINSITVLELPVDFLSYSIVYYSTFFLFCNRLLGA